MSSDVGVRAGQRPLSLQTPEEKNMGSNKKDNKKKKKKRASRKQKANLKEAFEEGENDPPLDTDQGSHLSLGQLQPLRPVQHPFSQPQPTAVAQSSQREQAAHRLPSAHAANQHNAPQQAPNLPQPAAQAPLQQPCCGGFKSVCALAVIISAVAVAILLVALQPAVPDPSRDAHETVNDKFHSSDHEPACQPTPEFQPNVNASGRINLTIANCNPGSSWDLLRQLNEQAKQPVLASRLSGSLRVQITAAWDALGDLSVRCNELNSFWRTTSLYNSLRTSHDLRAEDLSCDLRTRTFLNELKGHHLPTERTVKETKQALSHLIHSLKQQPDYLLPVFRNQLDHVVELLVRSHYSGVLFKFNFTMLIVSLIGLAIFSWKTPQPPLSFTACTASSLIFAVLFVLSAPPVSRLPGVETPIRLHFFHQIVNRVLSDLDSIDCNLIYLQRTVEPCASACEYRESNWKPKIEAFRKEIEALRSTALEKSPKRAEETLREFDNRLTQYQIQIQQAIPRLSDKNQRAELRNFSIQLSAFQVDHQAAVLNAHLLSGYVGEMCERTAHELALAVKHDFSLQSLPATENFIREVDLQLHSHHMHISHLRTAMNSTADQLQELTIVLHQLLESFSSSASWKSAGQIGLGISSSVLGVVSSVGAVAALSGAFPFAPLLLLGSSAGLGLASTGAALYAKVGIEVAVLRDVIETLANENVDLLQTQNNTIVYQHRLAIVLAKVSSVVQTIRHASDRINEGYRRAVITDEDLEHMKQGINYLRDRLIELKEYYKALDPSFLHAHLSKTSRVAT